MVQSQGFVNSSTPTHAFWLKKALYSLKQAPGAWYSTFSAFLLTQGFHNSVSNTSLFIRKTSTSHTLLVIYVDDILLTRSDNHLIDQLLHQMPLTFSMKELGSISYFLMILVLAHRYGYFLSQRKYAAELLLKAGLVDCKLCSTPSAIKTSSSPSDDLPFSHPSFYRSIVEGHQYLTITASDLSLAVNQGFQHMHAPTIAHFQAIKRLLRYIKGTISWVEFHS